MVLEFGKKFLNSSELWPRCKLNKPKLRSILPFFFLCLISPYCLSFLTLKKKNSFSVCTLEWRENEARANATSKDNEGNMMPRCSRGNEQRFLGLDFWFLKNLNFKNARSSSSSDLLFIQAGEIQFQNSKQSKILSDRRAWTSLNQ